MSGGEKYMLSLALALSKEHNVSLFWDPKDKEAIASHAKARFDFDLAKLKFTPNIFSKKTSLLQRLQKSKAYDRIIYLSDGSIPFVSCPLLIHFQTPMQWVDGHSLKNRFKISRVKKIICNSQFTKSYIDKTFSVKSVVLYPPVFIPELNSKIVKENTILHVGRFGITTSGSSFKKQDVLVKAFKEMVDQGFNNWQLVLVMSVKKEDLEKAEQFIKETRGYPIKVVINPKNQELWEWYQKAKLYWHASGFGEDLASHPDRAEHFGISTVEAMGTGAVPLSFKAGGQPEIISDGMDGYLWEDVADLKTKTLELATNQTLYVGLSQSARGKAKLFSEAAFKKKAEELVI